MKKINIVLWLFAVAFILVSCHNGTTGGIGGGGGRIDPALVGKWYSDEYDGAVYIEFTSDGRYVYMGTVMATYSTSGGKITTYSNAPYSVGVRMGSAEYTVSGNKLIISYPEASSGLTFTPLLSKAAFHRA